MKALVPNTIHLDFPEVAGVQFVTYNVNGPIPENERDAEALVIWRNPSDVLADQVASLKGLKLAQTLSAGGDPLRGPEFPEGTALATGNGLHDAPVAEHAVALTLALVRRVPALLDAQDHGDWDPEGTVGAPELHPDGPITTLLDARVTIWGYGHIGRHLTGLLRPFGAEVRGLARSRRTEDGVEIYPSGTPGNLTDEAREVLASTDVLIMILPSGESTRGALGAEALEALPDTAFVVNVGRGTTVDSEALLEALEHDDIAGAALDVTDPEPLPEDSPLWSAATIVTPHVAGNRPVGAERLIVHNIRAVMGEGDVENLVEPDEIA